MKKNFPSYNYEIDLAASFKVIWDSKIKVILITIISFLVGFGYIYQKPKSYLNSLTIYENQSYELIQLYQFKELIQSKVLQEKEEYNKKNYSYLVNFMNEFKDYDEFLLNIKNSKIGEHISKLKIKDQEEELFKYARLLEIVEPINDEGNYSVNLKWHDPDEAKKLLKDTLNLTSKNLKKKIQLELKQAIEFEKKIASYKDMIRLDFLNEQSAIAKELNIVDNQIDNVNLDSSSVSLNINTANIAYYLRGYRAIDKEIELIQNRKYENLKLLEQELENLKVTEIDLIKYNIHLINVKSLKNSKLILIISIFLGLIVGISYAHISNVFQSQTASKK